MISIAHPHLVEEEAAAILGVLASGKLAQGERVAAFVRRFAEGRQLLGATAISSGANSLQLTPLASDDTGHMLEESALTSHRRTILPFHHYGDSYASRNRKESMA